MSLANGAPNKAIISQRFLSTRIGQGAFQGQRAVSVPWLSGVGLILFVTSLTMVNPQFWSTQEPTILQYTSAPFVDR